MKDTQLKKDIMKLALAESATECTIVCGTLFAKFDVSIHEQMAKNLKNTLQTFFDKRKKNVSIVGRLGPIPVDLCKGCLPKVLKHDELTLNDTRR